MVGGTERDKRYPKGFRLTSHQIISKSEIEVREKRKQDIGYHEAMKMYMEEYKESKGNSSRACCEEIGSKYTVSIAVSTLCQKVQLAEKVSYGEATTNLIQ